MEIEQLEIRDYLYDIAPLSSLGKNVLDEIVEALEITYARRGKVIMQQGGRNEWLYLVRTGACEVHDADGNLLDHYDQGDWIGFRSLLRSGEIKYTVKASEDCLLYMVPGDLFHRLFKQHPVMATFFAEKALHRLRGAIDNIRDTGSTSLIATQVREMTHGKPLLLDGGMSIREVAQQMRDKTVTAMLVTENGQLAGIVTDRAFCTKVTADGMNTDKPVVDIMTPDPLTIPASTPGSEALLLMARHNVRHLPVTDDGKVIGMITATDLIRHQSNNAIYLINEIHRAASVEDLKILSKQLPETLVSLVESSLTPHDIGHAVSSIGEAINQRLLKMAEQEFGPPPVAYAWVMAGSLARYEQTAHSDQDSALILSDDFVEQEHDDYFQRFCQFVSDGLNECGYVYCPGDVMATNKQWRQPQSRWREYFSEWIDNPQPKALMYSSIFFDLRCARGDASLLADLQKEVLKKTPANTIFLAYMASNALQYQPPLGLFRHFVLEKSGAEEKALNMKKRGVVPITDLARVYALSAGLDELNTRDRLEASAEAGALSTSGMEDLRDAYEFISEVRLKHQALQIRQGKPSDNFVPPEQLSSLERRHLKDAFEVVRTMQEAMSVRYQTGRIG